VHFSIHLEEFLSQGGSEGVGYLRHLLWFVLFVKLFLELLDFDETLLTHLHLVFHNQLLTALLSNVGAVKLVKLLLIVLKHSLLLFSSHTSDSVVLFETILTLDKSLSDSEFLVCSISFLLPLATHHIFIVRVLLLQVLLNFIGDCLLLKLNRTNASFLLSVLQLLESLKSLFIELSLGIVEVTFTNKLLTEFCLIFRETLSKFNLFLHVLLVHLLTNSGLLLSMQSLNNQVSVFQ